MSTPTDAETLERQRIRLLLDRDGRAATTQWVERTRKIYTQALATSHSHASAQDYRPGFEASIRVFDAWLQNPEQVDRA